MVCGRAGGATETFGLRRRGLGAETVPPTFLDDIGDTTEDPGEQIPSAAPSPSPSPVAEDAKAVSEPRFAVMPAQQRCGDADVAAGPSKKYITLSSGGRLTALCCGVPGCILFGIIGVLIASAFWDMGLFYAVTAGLSFFTLTYSCNLAIFAYVGARNMREEAAVDWNAKLRQFQQESQERGQEETDCSHFVILPNYKEDEDMLMHTLENIGRAPEAKDSIRVILAMEEREGVQGKEKAERLMQLASHMFKDIVAFYHPANRPGEIAGKSANTQWAYRETLRHYNSELMHADASRVFLTVGDADTLWHPQFFSALAYKALQLPAEERSWSFWQPPILLMRNLFSVPAPTRLSGYVTILFELAGLANQKIASHFAYSAYSLTLALASHPLVTGWDADVIAEDHHMYCKCYFASIWEAAGANTRSGVAANRAPLESKVQLRPIWLPAVSFLVEADGGWIASSYARFQQARRHSQGVSELSYVILQYIHLILKTGMVGLPFSTHWKILAIAFKMATVHIINTLQAFALLLTSVFLFAGFVQWACTGGLASFIEVAGDQGIFGALSSQSLSRVVMTAIITIFGPVPPVGFLMTVTTYTVILDLLEGRLTQQPLVLTPDRSIPITDTKESNEKDKAVPRLAAPDVQGSANAAEGTDAPGLSLYRKLSLAAMIQNDYISMAEATMLFYGMVPCCLAAWSLLCNGPKFEYIVAAKPQ